MNGPLPIDRRRVIPARDMVLEFSRSGGAGGQHVNKTETRVRLRFDLENTEALTAEVKARLRNAGVGQVTDDGELLLVADRHRSRHRNIQAARERLVAAIRIALVPPKKRRATRPTKGSKVRRLKAKRVRGDIKKMRGRVTD